VLEDNHVEFDRVQARLERRLDALEDLLVGPTLGHRGEILRIERVLRDVDPLEAGVHERFGAAGEERPVRGQRNLHLVGCALDDLFQVLSKHRLPTGELDRIDVELGGDLEESDDVVGRHFVVLRIHRSASVPEPLVVTVDAVEVTPIGERDANPGDLSPELVGEHATGLQPDPLKHAGDFSGS